MRQIGANCFSEKSSHTKAVGLGYGAGSWNEGDNNTAIGYQSVGLMVILMEIITQD